MKKAASAITFIIVLSMSAAVGIQLTDLARAQTFASITIKADGSIDPSTTPITRAGNVYTLTGDVAGSITVEKFDIVIDGAGHSVLGNGTGRGIQLFNPYNSSVRSSYDVTIKNFNVKGFEEGIDVFGYWGNIISGVTITQNNVAENGVGIRFSSYSRYSNNTIVANNITANGRGIAMEMGQEGDESGNTVRLNQIENNEVGMWFMWLGDYYGSKPDPFYMNNRIFENNFLSNTENVVNAQVIYFPGNYANIWDNGSHGNYWSDYSTRYPNASEVGTTGVSDTPYFINENNIDHYPLLAPLDSSATEPYSASPLLSMPEEHLNYTITMVNGTFYAKIDGTYPIQILNPLLSLPESLPLLYPIPPGTTNIHIKLDETELQWSNFTQMYLSALHHTAIGDWQIINCTITPVPDSFVLKIHYEHPIASVNGSCLLLYDLNISPYLSPRSPTSTAYFQIRTDSKISNLKACTTQTDNVWNPVNSTMSYEGTTRIFAIQIHSEYFKPLAGDLVVTFEGEVTPQSFSLPAIAALTVAITAAGAGLTFRHHKKHAKRAESA